MKRKIKPNPESSHADTPAMLRMTRRPSSRAVLALMRTQSALSDGWRECNGAAIWSTPRMRSEWIEKFRDQTK